MSTTMRLLKGKEEVMGRKLEQTKEAIGVDLRHLQTVHRRALENEARPRKRNAEILGLIGRAILLYQEEFLGENGVRRVG